LNLKLENLISILGPTASGKTGLAVNLAAKIDGEIISVDSRQVNRKMDIGTGKDLSEYNLKGREINYHLIDIIDAGDKYSLFDFKRDCILSIERISKRGNKPILCGGTGMYFDSIFFDYDLPEVDPDIEFRKSLENKSMEELVNLLSEHKNLHNTTDTEDRQRLIRALEIARVVKEEGVEKKQIADFNYIFGLRGDREKLKERIENRLKSRLEGGMIEEVKELIDGGMKKESLLYYGLEYKFVGQYLYNELTYNDMYQKLRTAIFKFSKKQMTWFRRMEKKGIQINWLDFESDMEQNISIIMNKLNGK